MLDELTQFHRQLRSSIYIGFLSSFAIGALENCASPVIAFHARETPVSRSIEGINLPALKGPGIVETRTLCEHNAESNWSIMIPV